MDGIKCLREAISNVPVPGAPPRLSHDGAVVGLAFLDIALRLNHVRRLSERLSLVEHRIARRTTEIDISLNMLDSGQSAAAKIFNQLVGHHLTEADREPVADDTLWVPVARIARRSAEPVDVRDASGRKVPRLTQYETSRLLASGMYRLLRESLSSHPDSSTKDCNLNLILRKVHEPRWLIQAALLTLFTERNRPDEITEPKGETPGTAPGHVRQYRDLALYVFDRYQDYLKDYAALLDVALNEHLLVVALDPASDEHLLTYESPLYVNERLTPLQGLQRVLRASVEGYYVQYHTSIPSALRSYHLAFESGPGVDISHIYLSTDADSKTVGSLEADLFFLADCLKKRRQEGMIESADKLLELETQTALRRVAEVVRRRGWDASHAGIALPERYLQASLKLTQAAVAGEAKRGTDDKINNSILTHPSISPENFLAAAEELASRQMFNDLSLERDPVTSHAHAYWRRSPERVLGGGQIQIGSGVILRDATGAGRREALFYALALVSITYLVACFLTHSFWPYSGHQQAAFQNIHSTEGVIAVLLLVPGFLYTRLTLPDPHSVSGHLRAVPRLVAMICISSIVAVAASVAATNDGRIIRWAFILGTALPLASTLFLFRRRPLDLKRALGRMGAPWWAGEERAKRPKAVKPDVRFQSAGGGDE